MEGPLQLTVWLLATALAPLGAGLVDGSGPGVPTCVPHPPIEITETHGPSGFTWTNPATGAVEPRPGSGVTGGRGSPANPFVISGWCIVVQAQEGSVGVSGTQAEPFPKAGIHLNATSAHVVMDGNQVLGPMTSGVGILLVDASNVQVRDNRIDLSARAGIHLAGSSGNTLEDNELTNVTGDGIALTGSYRGTVIGGSTDNLVRGNTIRSPGLDGIIVSGGSDGNRVVGNRIVDAREWGLFLWGAEGTLVQGNEILRTGQEGVWLLSAHGNTLEGNRIGQGFLAGLRLSHASSNEVLANTVTGNAVGLEIDGGSHGNQVQGNEIAGNGYEGVHLDRTVLSSGAVAVPSGTILHDNDLHGNGKAALRVDAHQDVVDARENWWGAGSGPSGGAADACTGTLAQGSGGTIEGAGVCFDPWHTAPQT